MYEFLGHKGIESTLWLLNTTQFSSSHVRFIIACRYSVQTYNELQINTISKLSNLSTKQSVPYLEQLSPLARIVPNSVMDTVRRTSNIVSSQMVQANVLGTKYVSLCHVNERGQ